MKKFLALALSLILLAASGASAWAQVCPGGSTCTPWETYIYGSSTASPPLAGSLRIPIVPNASASSAQYVAANILLDTTSTQTASGKSFTSPTMTGTVTLSGITGSTQCLQVNTSGVISGTGAVCGSGGGGIGGSGTTNFIPKFTASTTLGNSLLSDSGTALLVNYGSGSTPTAPAGTVLQVVGPNSTNARIELDAFGTAKYDTVCLGATGGAVGSGINCGGYDVFAFNGASSIGPLAGLKFVTSEAQSSGHGGMDTHLSATPVGSTTPLDRLVVGGAISQLNYNAVAAPTPTAGTILQMVGPDSTNARVELSAFGIPKFDTIAYGGTGGSPTAVGSGVIAGGYDVFAYAATGSGNGVQGPLGGLKFVTTEAQSTGHGGMKAVLSSTPNASTTPVDGVTLDQNGAVTITALASGSTQCVQVSSAGLISGTGSACGSAGGGITILTGDGTTPSGGGSQPLTLATVNSTVGSFTNANITVNGKGLVTAAANGTAPPTGANPTASVSGSAVNGSATTFMRSDAAPPLANTAVTAGSYTSANITVDAQGRLTAAANGSGGGTPNNFTGTFAGTTTTSWTVASPNPSAPSANTAYNRICGFVAANASSVAPTTLAVGTAGALPVKKWNITGLVNLNAGDITTQVQTLCLSLDSGAANWILDGANPLLRVNAGTYNITVADCQNNTIFRNDSGTNALTLPTSASLSGGACGLWIQSLGNVVTLIPQGSDTINGANATYTFRSDTLTQVTLNGTAWNAPVEGYKAVPLTFGEGQNLSTNPRLMRILGSVPLVVYAVECAITVAAGVTDTLQLVYSASPSLSSPTNIGTTCNANSATLQTGLLTTPVVVPANSIIGFTASASSTAAVGMMQFRE